MKPCVLGVNHVSTPMEIRSRFAFTDSGKIEFTALLQDRGIQEVVILSTCNRSEVYFFVPETGPTEELVQNQLLEYLDAYAYRDSLFLLTGQEAVLHLFRVAAGLDSIVVGEDQILGQVRQAYEFSLRLGAAKKLTNRLFRDAITWAKQVKTGSGISQIPLSASYIGIKLLSRLLGGLTGKRFLIVGFGEVNRLTLRYLLDGHAQAVFLCSQNEKKVREAAGQSKQIVPVPFDQRYACLEKVDAVITATSSPHTIFQRSAMPAVPNPLLFLDLAVPPDVAGDVEAMPDIQIYNVDDLKAAAQENLAQRQTLAQEMEKQAWEASGAFIKWSAQTQADPAIQTLNHRCQIITDDISSYLANKLELTEKEKKLVAKMVSSGLRRLIREPVHKLKQAQSQELQEGYLALVKELFEI